MGDLEGHSVSVELPPPFPSLLPSLIRSWGIYTKERQIVWQHICEPQTTCLLKGTTFFFYVTLKMKECSIVFAKGFSAPHRNQRYVSYCSAYHFWQYCLNYVLPTPSVFHTFSDALCCVFSLFSFIRIIDFTEGIGSNIDCFVHILSHTVMCNIFCIRSSMLLANKGFRQGKTTKR